MMLFMIIAILGIVVVTGLVASSVLRLQLSRPSPRFEQERLEEQAHRIEFLEDQLQRLKEQADFTERLLAERGSASPADEVAS